VHVRAPYDVHHQVTVRANRDTLYSWGVFALTTPLTVHLPEPDGRYQSLMTVSQDHSIQARYSPATITLTADTIATRYVALVVRTFADPTDAEDLASAHALQDRIATEQADTGVFDVPSWDQTQVERMRSTLGTLAALATDSSKAFGREDDLDPVYWALGAAMGWGGLPAAAAMYEGAHPDRNDGHTPYTLTVGDVPCDGFWSVTLYDAEGWMPVNDLDAYSYNNVTAERSGGQRDRRLVRRRPAPGHQQQPAPHRIQHHRRPAVLAVDGGIEGHNGRAGCVGNRINSLARVANVESSTSPRS
jgi:hypothetical protein